MKTLGKIIVALALTTLSLSTYAQLFEIRYDFNVNPAYQNIPDALPNGPITWVDTRTVPPGIGIIEYMRARVNIQGNPVANNGDYYITLRNNLSGLQAVLVNRPGFSADLGGTGYIDNGMNVTFQEFVLGIPGGVRNNDFHIYQAFPGYVSGSPVTGVFAPDSRNADPKSVKNDINDPVNQPLKGLSQYRGMNSAGDWSLFVSDMAQGGQGKLVSWGLDFVGVVPEPREYAMITGLVLIGFAAYRRFAVKLA